jgi:hypothetical protein
LASFPSTRLRRARTLELPWCSGDVSTRFVAFLFVSRSLFSTISQRSRPNEPLPPLRTGQQHATSRNEGNVAVFQLNESLRAVLRELDVPVFECKRLVFSRCACTDEVSSQGLELSAESRTIVRPDPSPSPASSSSSLLTASSSRADDDQHLTPGAPARLFGDMALFYLRRAVQGWNNCNSRL